MYQILTSIIYWKYADIGDFFFSTIQRHSTTTMFRSLLLNVNLCSSLLIVYYKYYKHHVLFIQLCMLSRFISLLESNQSFENMSDILIFFASRRRTPTSSQKRSITPISNRSHQKPPISSTANRGIWLRLQTNEHSLRTDMDLSYLETFHWHCLPNERVVSSSASRFVISFELRRGSKSNMEESVLFYKMKQCNY